MWEVGSPLFILCVLALYCVNFKLVVAFTDLAKAKQYRTVCCGFVAYLVIGYCLVGGK